LKRKEVDLEKKNLPLVDHENLLMLEKVERFNYLNG
jgi:hypothetical protein